MTKDLATAIEEIQAASAEYVAEFPDDPKPVERGIWRPCVALRMHGINTSGSCEGHVQYPGSLPYITFTPLNYNMKGGIDPVEWDEQIETVSRHLRTFYWVHRPIRAPILVDRRGKTGYRGRDGRKLPQVVTLACRREPTFFSRWGELGRYLLLPDSLKQARIEKDRAEFDYFAAYLEFLLGVKCPTIPPGSAN